MSRYGERTIREAHEADLPVLREIERAAGQSFREIGMIEVADDEPPTLETLREFQRAGRAWVCADTEERPVAYLIAGVIDGNVHVEQVSVRPEWRGLRIGWALIEHAAGWARAQGITTMTLTTFTEVPWNGPYYERRGFVRIPEVDVTVGLGAIRLAEKEHGLDRWPRVCMRRDLATVSS